jgi:ABC-2 type transport system permease protein
MTALTALTERMVLATLRNDLPFAILTPVGIFLFFDLSLGKVIDTGAMSYSQYILPVIVVQVIFLGGLTTVDRAAGDALSDFGVRLRTLPISVAVPLTARMLYCLFRGTLALLAAIAIAYPFGFRMVGGFVYGAAFTVLVLMFTLAVSLAADSAGFLSARHAGRSQLLLVPQMLLIMLSSGMAPVDSFPNWLHPFVRYQPVSQVTETLRGFATGHVVLSNLATSSAWCLGLLVVFGAIAVRLQRRTE